MTRRNILLACLLAALLGALAALGNRTEVPIPFPQPSWITTDGVTWPLYIPHPPLPE